MRGLKNALNEADAERAAKIGRIPNRVVKDVINNTALVGEFRDGGGQILHIRPRKGRRGMTFAFVIKGSRIEVATSVQHRDDAFTKKLGTKIAIQHFRDGQTVFLPIASSKKRAVMTLQHMACFLG